MKRFASFTDLTQSVASLREAATSSTDSRLFRGVTILAAGMGNRRDKHVYTPAAMKEAVDAGMFDGLRAFLDHPTSIDEEIQPERTLRDFVGVYTNPRFVEGERGVPARVVADLRILKPHQWLADSVRELVEAGMADRIGISILGSGRTEPGKWNDNGNEIDATLVEKFTAIDSGDLVTKAGAGGGFTRLIESARGGMQMKTEDILKQIAEAAQAGDADAVKTLSAKLAESGAEPKDKIEETADDAPAEDGGEPPADAPLEEAKDDEPAEGEDPDDDGEEGAEELSEEEAEGDCPCKKGKMTKEANASGMSLPGSKAASGTAIAKKAKRKDKIGKPFAESECDRRVRVLEAENRSLRLKAHATEQVKESGLPLAIQKALMPKLLRLASLREVDAEIQFQKTLLKQVRLSESARDDDEADASVEGAGGSSYEGIGGDTGNDIDTLLREAGVPMKD
jgi:hypothetical protein